MTRPLVQISLLALLSIGIAGLLFGNGAGKWLLLELVAFPLPFGGLAILVHQAFLGYCDLCDRHSAEI